MASILQHRRGGYSIRANMIPAVGELFEDTDVGGLFFGDGSTYGGFLAGAPDVVGVSAGSYNANGVDVGRLLVFTGTGTAVALSQAGAANSGLIDNHTGFHILNLSSGNVVVTPTTSTINNNPTLTVPPNNFATIWSDGTNYYAFLGTSSGSVGTVTSVATGTGLTGGPITTSGTISAALTLSTKTTGYSVLAGDNLKHFDNIGAGGTVNFALPAAAAGLGFSFLVVAAQTVQITANGTDVIHQAGLASSAGGNFSSNVPYSSLSIEAHASGHWAVVSAIGPWTAA